MQVTLPPSKYITEVFKPKQQQFTLLKMNWFYPNVVYPSIIISNNDIMWLKNNGYKVTILGREYNVDEDKLTNQYLKVDWK